VNARMFLSNEMKVQAQFSDFDTPCSDQGQGL